MTYYQWLNGGVVVVTPDCSHKLGCPHYSHTGGRKLYWAWDRSLGAWVHYVAVSYAV